MPELDEKKRIIAYDTVNDPDENYYALIDNGTAGTGKVSIKGLGPADMISDQYSDSSTYKVGDLCIHNNKLYVCTVAINTPHAFNLSEWELDTLGNYASEIKQSLSNLKHVPITTDTATFPSTVSIQGDNYYQKVGRLVIVNVNLKIVSSTKGWHRVTNYIPNNADRPIYGVLGSASDGDVDGIMQPFDITSQGTLEIYNTKTGTTYCQGSVAYFANDLG